MSKVNINGVWKDLDKVFVNIGGIWKEAEKMFCNIGGVWKEVEGLVPAPFVQVFTSSQNWVVPPGVTKLTVHVISGGYAGAQGYENMGSSGGAVGGNGGSGGGYKKQDIVVTPGTTIPVVIGAGGTVNVGGDSSFGTLVSPWHGDFIYGWQGGHVRGDTIVSSAYIMNGGLDSISVNGILYGGGGGAGAAYYVGKTAARTLGRARGGGDGGTTTSSSANNGGAGIPNTGGGGGGGAINLNYQNIAKGGNGGSGVVIIEWKGEGV